MLHIFCQYQVADNVINEFMSSAQKMESLRRLVYFVDL
jgi:hypothetical protein